MEILITAVVVSALNVACFFIGARIGQQVDRGEKIQMPVINPMQMFREKQDKKEANKEQKRLETILENIERYDGTDSGQQDIPR